MKKLLLALTIVSLFVLSFGVLSVSAAYRAPYLSQYTEEEVPATDDRYYVPVDGGKMYMEWDQTPATILDGYDPASSASSIDLFANGIGQMDNNQKALTFDFGVAVTADALVFADGFTTSGSHYGASRIKPSDWEERFTFFYSVDGQNWTQSTFTVSFHVEASEFTDVWMGSTVGDIDLFWHINFEAPVTARYFLLHTNNESHQDDALYELAVVCHMDYYYLLLSDEQVTVTTEDATDAPATTDAPVTTEAATTTEAPATTDEGAADTADFAVASLAIAAVAAAGVVLTAKKRKH